MVEVRGEESIDCGECRGWVWDVGLVVGRFVQFVYCWVPCYVQGWVVVGYLQYVQVGLRYLQLLQGIVVVVQYEHELVDYLRRG